MKGKITKLLQLVQIDYNQNKWCAKGNQEKFQKNENLLICVPIGQSIYTMFVLKHLAALNKLEFRWTGSTTSS